MGMPMAHTDVGREGEAEAAKLLRRSGYRVLARNYRCRHGEIDIVAFEGGEYVFVEVKTRRTDGMGSALDAVTPAKQRRIARVAEQYLAERGIEDRPCRFDVVAMSDGSGDGNGSGSSGEIVRGAFSL